MKKILATLAIIFFAYSNYAQEDTISNIPVEKVLENKVFGNIHSGFYYGLKDNITPRSSFILPTALLGYTREISYNVRATLIYDVFRTTSLAFTDSSGVSDYFEGSKYTAFLKMAQIDWYPVYNLQVSVGQMLNEQYLTVQDRWWGHRYIDFTFQEKYRFGMPADFGARVKYTFMKKLKVSLTAVNGDGPFKHQDDDGKFLFSGNIEYTPIEKLMIKVYADYQTAEGEGLIPRSAMSGFVGYDNKKIMAGVEYNLLMNSSYLDSNNDDYNGVSVYGAYNINERFQALGRLDLINRVAGMEEAQYFIVGFQYKPASTYRISINYRDLLPESVPLIYTNFGIRF